MATINGDSGDNMLNGTEDADTITGGGGNDTITGLGGGDTAVFNVTTDGADTVDLGDGSDVVRVSADAPTEVRLTFTSAQVGNGNPNDSNSMPNQDGGLAVRLQAEDGSGALNGPVSRYDDEGTTFVGGTGVTFDVRDLVSGVQRGNLFQVVTLGTMGADTLTAVQPARPYYFNGGMGDDTISGGSANDFLVGGAGLDSLNGGAGNDSYIGGGGNDTVTDTDGGNDIAIFNVTTDGADAVNLGVGSDAVNVTSVTPGQVRLTFTSAQVGNGNANDSNTMPNQDGGLAVRLQAEDGSDALIGPVSRYDDEGITFVGGVGVTFDVRDLVSGIQRGDAFEIVTLGTTAADTLTAIAPARPYYFNGGMGNDSITGGLADDFLVGGAGNDTLFGSAGNDQYIGGAGTDRFTYAIGAENGFDTIIDFGRNDLFVTDTRLRDGNQDGIITFGGNDLLNLGGDDTVAFTGVPPQSGLRFLGALGTGGFAYGDARTRPDGATEGTTANNAFNGASGASVFFFDTALDIGFGKDTIASFGTDDILVTTTAIKDSNGDGRIGFAANRMLDLSDGTQVTINGGALRQLEFDGSVTTDGVTYYVYSRVGTANTGVDDLLA